MESFSIKATEATLDPFLLDPFLLAFLSEVFFFQLIIDIYTESSTHPKVVFREVLYPIELELRNVDFWGEGKTGEPGEKPLGAEYRINNQLNPLVARTRAT